MVKKSKKVKPTQKQKQKQSIVVNINNSSKSSRRRSSSSSKTNNNPGFYQQVPPIIIQSAPPTVIHQPQPIPTQPPQQHIQTAERPHIYDSIQVDHTPKTPNTSESKQRKTRSDKGTTRPRPIAEALPDSFASTNINGLPRATPITDNLLGPTQATRGSRADVLSPKTADNRKDEKYHSDSYYNHPVKGAFRRGSGYNPVISWFLDLPDLAKENQQRRAQVMQDTSDSSSSDEYPIQHLRKTQFNGFGYGRVPVDIQQHSGDDTISSKSSGAAARLSNSYDENNAAIELPPNFGRQSDASSISNNNRNINSNFGISGRRSDSGPLSMDDLNINNNNNNTTPTRHKKYLHDWYNVETIISSPKLNKSHSPSRLSVQAVDNENRIYRQAADVHKVRIKNIHLSKK